MSWYQRTCSLGSAWAYNPGSATCFSPQLKSMQNDFTGLVPSLRRTSFRTGNTCPPRGGDAASIPPRAEIWRKFLRLIGLNFAGRIIRQFRDDPAVDNP